MNKNLTKEQYEELCSMEQVLPHLECDGLTLVLSQWLWQKGIDHVRHAGIFRKVSTGYTLLHHWISFPDREVLCFRSRMWLGPDAPHGLFRLPVEDIQYVSHIQQGPVQSDKLVQILFGIPPFDRALWLERYGAILGTTNGEK